MRKRGIHKFHHRGTEDTEEECVIARSAHFRAGGEAPCSPGTKQSSLDCFAEPVLGPAFGRTRGLAVTERISVSSVPLWLIT